MLVFTLSSEGYLSMKLALLFLLNMMTHLLAADLKRFAPAIEFTGVEWLSIGDSRQGFLGQTKHGRINGTQELQWLGRTYDIQSVEQAANGVIEVTFPDGKMSMTRDQHGFYTVDISTSHSVVAVFRFRTTRKALAHDDWK